MISEIWVLYKDKNKSKISVENSHPPYHTYTLTVVLKNEAKVNI